MSTTTNVPLTEPKYLAPFILITSLFFLWAFGVNLNDVLIPHFKKAFQLTDLQSSLIQAAFFGGYFLAALPAGWLMERIGYKKGILTGLMICATGALLFIPSANALSYEFFLFALFVMACGQSFLEVAANPYVTILGPPESSERRLEPGAIVQLGGRGGDAVYRRGVHFDEHASGRGRGGGGAERHWAVRCNRSRICAGRRDDWSDGFAGDEARGRRKIERASQARRRAAAQAPGEGRDRAVRLCGRAGGRGKLHHPLLGAHDSRTADKVASDLPAVSLDRIHDRPFRGIVPDEICTRRRACSVSSPAALSCARACAMFASGTIPVWGLVLIGFFHSIMFPTIFALGIKGLGPYTKLGSSLLVMAIIGGAVFPALMGYVSDLTNIRIAFGLPLLCYLYIWYYAAKGSIPEEVEPEAQPA